MYSYLPGHWPLFVKITCCIAYVLSKLGVYAWDQDDQFACCHSKFCCLNSSQSARLAENSAMQASRYIFAMKRWVVLRKSQHAIKAREADIRTHAAYTCAHSGALRWQRMILQSLQKQFKSELRHANSDASYIWKAFACALVCRLL